jgi:protein TonB
MRMPARRVPAYVWWFAALAIAAHGAFVWIASNSSPIDPPRPQKRELAVELVRPPEPVPPPPKVDPPKPVPKKVQRQVPVVPPIQTAVAEPAEVPSEAVDAVAAAPVGLPEPEPAPEPVTEATGYAGYLNNPPPSYPPHAVRNGWQGTVLLRVHVLSTGRVEAIEVQSSSGRKILDAEAVRTVKNWLFTPSKRGETPVDGWATVPIEFKLQS